MKESTKYIIIGVGVGLIGTIAYGVGYSRGGQYALNESKKEFEKIVDDAYQEADRHVKAMSDEFETAAEDLKEIVKQQRKDYETLWAFISDDEKKRFIMESM